jgi:hypothetical protein
VIVLVLLVSEIILAQLPLIHLIGTRGKIVAVGVGVYWDSDCASPVAYLDWGSVEPNSTKKATVFIRNEGNEPLLLFLNSTNWVPADASDVILLSWDYLGEPLYLQQTIRVNLTLSIAPVTEEIEDFTFDIIIGATELK